MAIKSICKRIFERKSEPVTNVYNTEPYGNGVALTPPMGWSSWNCFKNNIDADCLTDIADAMKKCGLIDAGYVYLNLDDCWHSSMRDENGDLQGDLSRFPQDIGVFIRKLNTYGVKVGLYTSNGTLTCEDLPASLGREKQDAYRIAKWGCEYFKYDFCHNIDYSKLAPLISGITIGVPSEKPFVSLGVDRAKLVGLAKLMKDDRLPYGYYALGMDRNSGALIFEDILVPEDGDYALTLVLKKLRGEDRYIAVQVNGGELYGTNVVCANKYNDTLRIQLVIALQKGANTIKLFNPIANLADSSMLQYTKMGKMLKWATKQVAKEENRPEKPIVFSLCEWGFNHPWDWGASAGNLWRTTGDIMPNWWRIHMIYNKTVDLYAHAVKGGYNDPDMLEVGNGNLTEDENKTHFALWCMMGAPLILGNDLRRFMKADGAPDLDNPTLKIVKNRELIAIDQDSLAKAGKRIKSGRVDVIAKPLSDGVAVCLYNTTKRSMNATFDLNDLVRDDYVKLIGSGNYELVNLWTGETVKTADRISATLPPHGSVVYKITYEK